MAENDLRREAASGSGSTPGTPKEVQALFVRVIGRVDHNRFALRSDDAGPQMAVTLDGRLGRLHIVSGHLNAPFLFRRRDTTAFTLSLTSKPSGISVIAPSRTVLAKK